MASARLQHGRRVKAFVVQPSYQPAQLAQLAPLVSEAAEAGNVQAAAILERSGDALAEAVQAVASSLGSPSQCSVPEAEHC